jgi:large subunit ribosomal protein L15
MTLGLHNLELAPGSRPRTRRLGRGHGSGRGTTGGRGTKGQRSRAGGAGGLKRLGLKMILRGKPKIGGFRSLKPKLAVVNVNVLEKRFGAGEQVTLKRLQQLAIVNQAVPGVKILGTGKLTKALTVTADAFSDSAKAAITAAGGTATVARRSKKSPAAKAA